MKNNKYFKGIITVHKTIKKQFLFNNVAEKRIYIHEDAVDLKKYDSIQDDKKKIREKLNLPLDKKIILYSGGLGEGKGVKTLLDASMLLKRENFIFYILGGRNNDINILKKHIKANNIQADIVFTGFRNNGEIPYYLKSADILIAPYSMKSKIIGWISPIKVYEYMAAKVPFIISNISRLKEICDNEEGLFFKVDDPKDLSAKIKTLVENKELQKKLIKKSYAKVKNHTYKIRCKKILENAFF